MTDEQPIELHGSLWMTVAGENFGGHGRMALLAKIAECGSITQAAKAMRMSYKAAWDAIDSMNNLAGEPLVQRITGGKGGGGTCLTERGERLVSNFRRIDREHQRFVEDLARQANGLADDYFLIRRMAMKSSARNQFMGTVSAIVRGAVNDEVELTLAGGLKIVATVTHDSIEELGLKLGSEAFALVKSSSIIVVSEQGSARFSARNHLTGQVSRVLPGAVNSEVVVELEGGVKVAAIITHESCERLALREGEPATVLFKASSVILGVPA